MSSRNRRRTQAADIKRRAKAPTPDGPESCVVTGCRRPTQRSASNGLSETYCRVHIEHEARHGHPTRSSYSKAELTPYREVARDWYRQHREAPHVRAAIMRLESLMSSQRRSKDHFHQRCMNARGKARNTLARLHEAGKTGEQLFLIVLSIRAAHAELGPHGYPEFPLVNIAKQAKRLRGAAGTHFREGPYQMPSRYPRPRGIYLRVLGEMIEERAGVDRETIEEIRRRARPQAEQPKDDTSGERERTKAFIRLMGGSI